jgi:hypothetical protein
VDPVVTTSEDLLDRVVRHGAHCAWQALPDEVVVVDLHGRRVMGLNGTGSHLWQAMDGMRTVAALADSLAAAYCVPVTQARVDTLAFVEAMVARGLLDVVGPGTSQTPPR